MGIANWDKFSEFGNLRSVIDPQDERGLKNMLIDRIHWNALRDHLVDSKSILDFGCGVGRFATRIKAMGIKYAGVDSSQGMIQAAKILNTDNESSFQHFDGLRIPFPDSSFDAILSCGVFIYILKTSDSSMVFSEIRRALVPGGHLIMLEQASLSGQRSGTVERVLMESDYVSALSTQFEIRSLHKVRSPEFSRLPNWMIKCKINSPLLFSRMVGPLAKLESKHVAEASDFYWSMVPYYDFLLDAVLLKKR